MRFKKKYKNCQINFKHATFINFNWIGKQNYLKRLTIKFVDIFFYYFLLIKKVWSEFDCSKLDVLKASLAIIVFDSDWNDIWDYTTSPWEIRRNLFVSFLYYEKLKIFRTCFGYSSVKSFHIKRGDFDYFVLVLFDLI